jgi:hypothetical protein
LRGGGKNRCREKSPRQNGYKSETPEACSIHKH